MSEPKLDLEALAREVGNDVFIVNPHTDVDATILAALRRAYDAGAAEATAERDADMAGLSMWALKRGETQFPLREAAFLLKTCLIRPRPEGLRRADCENLLARIAKELGE
jgi:hypothetical protein